jgi:hypothetical protein
MVLAAAFIAPAASAQYRIVSTTIDGGSGESAGAGYTVRGTIGQPDIGRSVDVSGWGVIGGYWQAPFFDPACNRADLAEPFGLLDLSDIVAFVTAFSASDAAADLVPPYFTWDLADLVYFVQLFSSGCP